MHESEVQNREFRFNMRQSISVLAVLCFLSFTAPRFAQKTPEPPKAADYEDTDGYVVLSILLSHAHSETDPSFLLAPFLLSALTVSGINADSFQSCSRVPTEFASAATDFRDKNKQNWNLTKKINLKFSYKFTNLKGKRPYVAPSRNTKDVPPALFETSVYQVSAVGFDASRTHAIAFVGAVCGPDCGSGSYHLLVKEKEGWKETTGSPVCQWMSFNLDFLFNRSPSWRLPPASANVFRAACTGRKGMALTMGCFLFIIPVMPLIFGRALCPTMVWEVFPSTLLQCCSNHENAKERIWEPGQML